MDNIRAMIDAIEAGKALEVEQHFNAEMEERIANAVDARRKEISHNLMNPVQDDDSHGL